MMRPTIRTTIGSHVFVTVALFAQLVTAQEAATRVVILDVAGGGTEELEAAFAELPRVELRDQKWFVAEVKKSDVRASRLMTRPDDLKFVMSSSGTSYVVAVQPDDDFWSVLFFDETGEAVREFEIERQADELSARKAASIRDIFVELLPASAPATDETAADEPDPEVVEDAAEPDDDAPASSAVDVAPRSDRPPPFAFALAGALVKRNETYIGANTAQLSFNSAFYPGARLDAALFPGGFSLGSSAIGVELSGLFGRDSVASETESATILHIEADLDLVLQATDALAFTLGAGHARFQLPENDLLPSTSTTYVRAGVRFEQRLGAVDIGADLVGIPYGLAGSDTPLFGESSRAHGFGGSLAIGYRLTETIGLRARNQFRVLRTSYPGQGTLDFHDTRAFGLVWGPDVGITLAF